MKYLESMPSPRLARFVKRFWSLEYPLKEGGDSPEPVVPDGCIEIVFNLSDRFRRCHVDGSIETQPSCLVAGQIQNHIIIAPSGSVRLFGIRFRPDGAFPFFSFEMSELVDLIEPLDSFWGRSAFDFEDRLRCCSTFGQQILIAENLLLDRMSDRPTTDLMLERIVDQITSSGGLFRISNVARMMGLSERALERRFKRYIGLTPKGFSRIVRFQRVLRAMETGASEGFLDAVHQFGYYDQSHLISDFRQYAGMTPTAFIKKNSGLTEILIADE